MSEGTIAPHVIVVAGPNGAGKSTTAPSLLRDTLEVAEFVNADTIAVGLSAFQPETVAVTAGRIMLRRMRQLARARLNFAFETTLAGRSLALWIAGLKRGGFRVHLLYLWLESADLAVSRVAERVRSGGHDVPEAIIRRRYAKGLQNLFELYMALADTWQVFDNSHATGPRPVAAGAGRDVHYVGDADSWRRLAETYRG